MLLCLPLLSQQLQLCASPPRFRVFGVSFHPPGFLLRLLSCAPSTLYSTWILFFFLVSFLWFWVSLSSFLLLSPLLEPSLLLFFVVCQVLAGGRSCNITKKKRAWHVWRTACVIFYSSMLLVQTSWDNTNVFFLYTLYSSFFFWCLVQSGLFLFLKLAFLCYSSTALAGGYSCVTLTLTLTLHACLVYKLLKQCIWREVTWQRPVDTRWWQQKPTITCGPH